MQATAKGNFSVTLMPQTLSEAASGSNIGRTSINKQFDGDLIGTSQGEMLSAAGSVKGSAAYVAIERVTGSLGQRQGSFVLQHCGIMDRGAARLTVNIIPDTGSGDFVGIAGVLHIHIVDGRHEYTLEYTLPD